MANLFGNKQAQRQFSEREMLESRYNSAGGNLLVVIIFTVINAFLLISNSNTYFLFTASLPYILLDLGMYLCGKYPAEYYGGDTSAYSFMNNGVFAFFVSMAILLVLFYLVCWLFAKKGKAGWLIAALVLFGFDTLMMFYWYGINVDMIMDCIFHIWIIFSLASGISAYYKLKKLPPESSRPINIDLTENTENISNNNSDSANTL